MPHICFVRSFSVLFALTFLSVTAAAQIFVFDSRAAFDSASQNVRTIDFEDVAPAKGFGKYAPGTTLNIDGISFQTAGGARFGSGTIYIPSAHYISGNPGLKMLDGAHLSWGAPNQPGNAHLELTLGGGVKALGFDIWTSQPIVSPIEITVTTRDGRSLTSTITTRKRPESTFAGFVSESEIRTVRFVLAKGQTSLLLDNLTYGGRAAGADLAALASKPTESNRIDTAVTQTRPAERPARVEVEASEMAPAAQVETADAAKPAANGEPAASQDRSGRSSSPTAAGNIAFVRDSKEIRLIAPDGSNDRRLWTHADAHEGLGINQLAWSPDGSELAFSSGHEAVASLYHADIYTMKSNGTGVRKITNGPDRADYVKYGKGTVTVTVRNDQPIYQTTKASSGVFFIYVVGADLPQPLTLPPGSSRILTFKNVADFGDHAQAIIAVYGSTRWFIPGTDVKAGRIVKAPDFSISGNGFELFGAFRPVWKRDGSSISYRDGVCIVSRHPARPTVGHVFDPVFKGEDPPAPCAWDWGPTPETADQFLYSVTTDDEITIYRMKEGGRHPGEKLLSISKEKYQFINDLRWLPDGSGFLFSGSDLAYSFANLVRFDLASRKSVELTKLEESFVKGFSISPDGKWVVFERTKGFVDDAADLWIVGIDGKGMRLLTKNAIHPAWGK